MKYVIMILVGIALIAGIISTFLLEPATAPVLPSGNEQVACTMDAMMCPDGSSVGRTGPNCEFVCPVGAGVPADVQAHIDSKADKIVLTSPAAGAVVTASPLVLSGKARGNWFFEASFPVSLVNWDGLIIADGIAQAEGEWMTTDFVPFKATLTFTNPYQSGQQEIMKRGTIILKKDNPSGLPENDDALEIPVRFAQ